MNVEQVLIKAADMAKNPYEAILYKFAISEQPTSWGRSDQKRGEVGQNSTPGGVERGSGGLDPFTPFARPTRIDGGEPESW